MKAVWGAVNKTTPPPPELIIGLDWRNFGTPYKAGGLSDQPIQLFRRIKEALYYYDAFVIYKNKPDGLNAKQLSEWNKRNKAIIKLVGRVVKDG